MREWVRHVHFVGIGGAGMSGIAQVLRKLDYRVSGSDLKDSAVLQLLRGQGAEIFIGHDPAHIAGAVLCLDDAGVREILPRVHKPVLTYGLDSGADVRAVGIRPGGLRTHFTAQFAGGAQAKVNLALPGRHNVQNALAALCVGRQLGVAVDAMQDALANFPGIKRRFQVHRGVRCPGGAFVLVDDYAHHPRELAATMAAAAAAWPGRRRVAVFQPHRHSRTRDLLDDFVQVLGAWEPLVLTEVYAAGEKPLAGGDGRALCRGIRAAGRGNPVFVPRIGDLPEALGGIVRDGDVVLLMGAGDIGGAAAEIAGSGLA